MAEPMETAGGFECTVCYQLYTGDPGSHRLPKSLSCGHTLCLECLHRVYAGDTKLHCPICRHPNNTSPEKLKTNHALVEAMEAKAEAVRRDARNRIFGAGPNGAADAPPCPLHGEPVRAYCTTDDKPVCVACVATDPCRTHHIEAAQGKLSEKRKAWAKIDEELVRHEHEMMQATSEFAATTKQIRETAGTAEEQVNLFVEQITAAVKKRGEELKKQLATARDRQCADIKLEAQALEQKRAQVTSHRNELKTLIALSDTQLLQHLIPGPAADPTSRVQSTLSALELAPGGMIGRLDGPTFSCDLQALTILVSQFGAVKELSAVQNVAIRNGELGEVVVLWDHIPDADEYIVTVDPNPRVAAPAPAPVVAAAATGGAGVRPRPGTQSRLATIGGIKTAATAPAPAPPVALKPVLQATCVAFEGQRQTCTVGDVPMGCNVTVRVRAKFVGNRVGPWSAPQPFTTQNIKIPNIGALPPLRKISLTGVVGRPTGMVELSDPNSVLVAIYRSRSGAAFTVRLDGAALPVALPAAPGEATALQPLQEGYILISYDAQRVLRTGSTPWARADIKNPFFLCLRGNRLLISEQADGKILQLDIATGATIATIGRGHLMYPNGIAIGPGNEIFVADGGTRKIHVFSSEGNHLRTMGDGAVGDPMGIFVDAMGQVYVCNWQGRTLHILNAAGTVNTAIPMPGQPRGVLVTRTGTIVVSHDEPDGLAVISPPP